MSAADSPVRGVEIDLARVAGGCLGVRLRKGVMLLTTSLRSLCDLLGSASDDAKSNVAVSSRPQHRRPMRIVGASEAIDGQVLRPRNHLNYRAIIHRDRPRNDLHDASSEPSCPSHSTGGLR